MASRRHAYGEVHESDEQMHGQGQPENGKPDELPRAAICVEAKRTVVKGLRPLRRSSVPPVHFPTRPATERNLSMRWSLELDAPVGCSVQLLRAQTSV